MDDGDTNKTKKGGGGQCRTEIKNLTAKYKKVEDGNRKSGNSLDSSFAYLVEMDAVRGIYIQGLHWNRLFFCACERDSD